MCLFYLFQELQRSKLLLSYKDMVCYPCFISNLNSWSIGNLAYLYLQSNVLNRQYGMYLVAWTSNLLENPLVFWCHIMLSLILSTFLFGEEGKTDIQWYTTAEYCAFVMENGSLQSKKYFWKVYLWHTCNYLRRLFTGWYWAYLCIFYCFNVTLGMRFT